MYTKGFIDGCFDGFHYGHVHALFQSKQHCENLYSASHCDEEILKAKKTLPIFSYKDRIRFLENCRFIDKCFAHVPYNTSLSVINGFGCDIFFHGSDGIDKFPLNELNKAGKLCVYNRTNGISTSNMLLRFMQLKNNDNVDKNEDLIYLKYLFNKINNTIKTTSNKKIIILKCSWDLINSLHLDLLSNIKDKYPNHSIYVDLISHDSSYKIFNKNEMAITLLGLKLIDKVLIYNDLDDIHYDECILINSCLYKGTIDTNFDNYIKYIETFKDNFLNHFDIDTYKHKIPVKKKLFDINLYKNRVKTQFDIILEYLQSIEIKDNDHIIFDIDEVCLCNLMYHNIHIDGFGIGIYNYETGIIPINIECKRLFDYIHKHNISYSFITGRKDYIRDVTIQNLDIVQLNKYKYLFTYPNDYIDNIYKFKEECRNKIYQSGLNIILCVGDQLSDITGEHTGQSFLIFNPFYITN
jgi:ethanolamine-phosphate cytidylyltransferase